MIFTSIDKIKIINSKIQQSEKGAIACTAPALEDIAAPRRWSFFGA